MIRSGQTLVATLIVIVIIGMLAVVMMNGSVGAGTSVRPDGLGTTLPGRAMYSAKDDACRSNMNQIRGSITIARSDADDAPPANLGDLNLPESVVQCPVGKEPYQYDSSTGKVKCPHPGHGKF